MTVNVLGMDVTVGKKPTPMAVSTAVIFNEIFCEMVEEIKLKKTLTYSTNEFKNEGVLRHGSFNLNQAKNWLLYYQLISAEKSKESVPKSDRQRTVWTLQLTKLGKQSFEHGVKITVNVAWLEKPLSIGIGKPYTSHTFLWKRVDLKAEPEVAKSRRESWYGEFRRFWLDQLAALPKEQAEKSTDVWAAQKIMASPKKKRRGLIKQSQAYVDGQVLFGQQASLMEFTKSKVKTKTKSKTKMKTETKIRRTIANTNTNMFLPTDEKGLGNKSLT